MYAVVKFVKDVPETTSEVPVSWLSDDNTKCYWPNTKNTSYYITRCISPNPSMSSLWGDPQEITLEGIYDTLEKARRRAALEDYSSSDDLNLGRGKRIPTTNPKYIDNEECNESEQRIVPAKTKTSRKIKTYSTQLTSLPLFSTTAAESKAEATLNNASQSINTDGNSSDSRNNDYVEEIISNLDEVPIVIAAECQNLEVLRQQQSSIASTSLKMQRGDSENNLKKIIQEHFQTISRMFSAIKVNLEGIDQRLKVLETGRVAAENSYENFDAITKLLPLKNTEDIQIFDAIFNNEEHKLLFKTFVQRVGGSCPKDNINRILKRLFTNSCATNCSWLGRKNNFKICGLTMVTILKEAICSSFSTLREDEFEQLCGNWFRFAKQRLDREK